MLSNLEILFTRLRDPAFASLLLEPLLLYGILLGVVFFGVGQHLGQPKCRTAALVVVGLCSLAILPFLGLRKQAMPSEVGSRPSDSKLIKEQHQRRVDTRWVYYALATAALLALLGGGRIAALANWVVLVGGLLVVFFSAWMHMKEAEIYHPNIIQRAVPVR